MSREELVSAFLEGRISRRVLIRRLIAGGVSTGAAVSYAQLLRPAQARAATTALVDDHYPLVDLTFISDSLATVIADARVSVSVASTEEITFAFFRVFLKTDEGGVPIGDRFYNNFLTAAGKKQAKIDIDTSQLVGLTKAVLYVQAQASDAENYGALASARKTLR